MSTNDETESKYPELVAYLDGELTPDARSQIEERLTQDIEYRQELAQLQKTWDMLDVLPAVDLPESFTQSTVEMVALSTANQARGTLSRKDHFRIALLIFGFFLPITAFCFGYWQMNDRMGAENREVIKDLEIIQRYPIYRSVNADISPETSLLFLELLSKEKDIFISIDQDVSETLRIENFGSQNWANDLINSKMEPEQLEKLALNKKAFNNLGSQRENMQKFHQLLSNHPNQNLLAEVLNQYYVWWRNRVFLSTQEEIDSIRDASPQTRIELIKNLEEEYVQKTFLFQMKRGRKPNIKDFKKIRDFGQKKIDQLIATLISADLNEYGNLVDIVAQIKRAPTNYHQIAILMKNWWEISNTNLSDVHEPEVIRELIDQLSGESRDQLVGLPPEVQLIVVQVWIVSTFWEIDNADLAQFEDNALNGRQRDSLLQVKSYNKKREILVKAIRYTLDPFQSSNSPRTLPNDLTELLQWDSFPKPSPKSRTGANNQ